MYVFMSKTPASPPAKVVAPGYIRNDDMALEEFTRVVRELGGVLRPVDVSLLASYALAHAECIRVREACQGEDYVKEGMKGGTYVNPIFNLLTQKENTLASLRRDLYFTPKSRAEKTAPKGKATGILDKLRMGEGSGEK
jgi:P27 family predicted phage terminase small subunit